MKPDKHQIDGILRDWARRQAIGTERLDRLCRTAKDRVAANPPSFKRSTSAWGRLIWPAAAAVAAAMLIIARIWSAGDHRGREKAGICPADAAGVERLLSSDDSARAAVLADAIQRLFAHEWRWVAQSDGNIEIETVAPDTMPGHKAAQSILVRFVVMTRPRGEAGWRTTWETDVLMRSEDFLDFKPDPTLANRLQLWVYPLGDGKVAIDTGVDLESPIHVATHAQNLVSEGKPVEILALMTDAAEYRVMQEVVILDLFEG